MCSIQGKCGKTALDYMGILDTMTWQKGSMAKIWQSSRLDGELEYYFSFMTEGDLLEELRKLLVTQTWPLKIGPR
jgi:hypothetical protein